MVMYDSNRHPPDDNNVAREQRLQRAMSTRGGPRPLQRRRDELVRRATQRRATAGRRGYW